MKHKDEIDQWLFDNVHVIPGCCSSIESLKYDIARDVAEKLWPKINPELTWQDIAQILTIYEHCVDDGIISRYGDYHSVEGASVEVLRRFNEQKEEIK